jgi:glycosyltransferase involved in cell wall biosynthesis
MDESKKISFIVPVYGNSGLFLFRCLNSLLDNQDYENKEVVVVYDGEENQLESALSMKEQYKDDQRVKFFTIEHGGAPKARNFGLNKTTGDYVCFFDCDSMLLAGGIRTWIKAFEDHPECDFVYGGYRYPMSENYSGGIPSQPFDPWLLTCNNYISSMNPIKREVCPVWDENLESLQDWDFWLRAVKAGLKGYMIPEWVVITEEPNDESISGKGHKNWETGYNAVREKNGIPKRDIVVTTFGAHFQAKRRAKFLNADYHAPEMLVYKPFNYKSIISMGYYIETPCGAYFPFINAKKETKKIIHFIGTDVYQLFNLKYRDMQYLRNELPKGIDKIFANAPWLVDELKEMGIESELLYCPIDASPYKVTPFPEKFTLAFYRSDSNNMHNEAFIYDVAKSCPDIKFKFFGGTAHKFADMPKNIEYLGSIKEEDMPDFIASTSGILRITVHDGFPATVAEWALSGRPFISNIEKMPFNNRYVPINITEQTFIQDKENLIREIRRLQKDIKNNNVKNLDEAKKFYTDLLLPEKYVKRINEVVYS